MIKSYFRSAWRNLLRNRQMTILNIAGLSIGMAASVMIFLWVQNELSYDRKNSEDVYSVGTGIPSQGSSWEGAPMLFAPAAKREVPGIADITRLNHDNRPVFQMGDQIQYEKNCAYVDTNWFDFFNYKWLAGDKTSLGINDLVLTVSAAKKYFGARNPLGETIRIDNISYKIKGVVADPPPNSSFQYQAYLPIAALETNPERRQHDEYWGNSDYRTFIRLMPKANLEAVNKSLTEVLRHYSQDDDHVLRAELTALKDIHFDISKSDTIFDHGDKMAVTTFSLLALVILLVACINYVNLTTAKASLRGKEVSIRKIVGAARRQLFMQFVAESALVSVASLGAALLLTRLSLPAFAQLTGKDFNNALTSPAIYKIMAGTLFAAFVLNSIYPALLLSSFKPLNIFRGITILKVKDVLLRKSLVVVQFSVAILLITATVVIDRQMHYIRTTNPGYDRTQIMLVSFPNHINPDQQSDVLKHKIDAIQQELIKHSSIEAVSLASQPIVDIGSMTNGANWDGKDTTSKTKVGQLSAEAGIQKLLGLQMTAGRWFQPGDEADQKNYILNETAVRELHIRQPVIGARFSLHGIEGQIVGVVKDFRYKSLHQKTGPLVIFNNPEWWQYFYIKVAPQNAVAAVAAVQDIWKENFPGVPLEYTFMDQKFDHLYHQDAIAGTLTLIFTVVAIVVSLIGLFGLSAFAAERRQKEVGIRKILGASILSIGTLLSWEFVRLVGIAIVLATPVAWWATSNWLQGFAYRIPISWWIFGLSAVAALTMALLITGYHAIRAARQNPVRSLRSE